MIHCILNPKVTSTLIQPSESIKEKYLKVFKYSPPQNKKVSHSHKTPLLIIISFIAIGYRHSAEMRVDTCTIWTDNTLHALAMRSKILNVCHLNQEMYLNLVYWRNLEHLKNLALSHLGFLTCLLPKTSENGNFLISSQ